MFIMTSNITIGKYKVKPSAVKWKTSVLSPFNTCTISLPRIIYLKNNLEGKSTKNLTKKKNPTFVFSEGDKVQVELGYDGRNTLRFSGFVKWLNVTETLELECEGYSYQLPKVFNNSYQSVKVKKLLTDVTQGTDIVIFDKIPEVTLKNVRFKNASGWQVLEYLQKEIHLTPFFDNEILYVGTRFGYRDKNQKPVKLQIGWNTAEDKDFKKRKTEKNVKINLVEKNSQGEIKKTKSDEKKYSETKEVKIKSGLNETILKEIANDLQTSENYTGYQGSITCFLEPYINKSDVVQIIDNRFPEREGLFFVETVEGSFDSSGGRQKVTLNYYYGG
jgi:hypothetical protein